MDQQSETPCTAKHDYAWGTLEWFQQKFQNQDSASSAAYFGHSNNAYQKMRHAKLLAFCSAQLDGAPAHIVDYGCATGELTALFAHRWPQAETRGYDFVPDLIAEAQARHRAISFATNSLPQVEDWAADGTLVILSEVLYYLDDAERRATLTRLRASAQGQLWVWFTSVVGAQYFTPESARALFAEYGFESALEVTSMPRYKRLIGFAAAYDALCAKLKTGASGKRRVERLVARLWAIAPLRWAMLGLRGLTRALSASDWLARLAMRLENTAANRARRPNNIVLLARLAS